MDDQGKGRDQQYNPVLCPVCKRTAHVGTECAEMKRDKVSWSQYEKKKQTPIKKEKRTEIMSDVKSITVGSISDHCEGKSTKLPIDTNVRFNYEHGFLSIRLDHETGDILLRTNEGTLYIKPISTNMIEVASILTSN